MRGSLFFFTKQAARSSINLLVAAFHPAVDIESFSSAVDSSCDPFSSAVDSSLNLLFFSSSSSFSI
ncbi:hypothetical protein RND71_008053 [Anisodus tanguticus]|uniref:Uncharacterized protein n=1 Tax=Anisodus tanguticus TaxID=243964 RepID=A0AAE1VTI5_9SOLA|nr:hypothetical protein RND71_008053 [Anisodus tanguticus]